jgi:hypothetical protein
MNSTVRTRRVSRARGRAPRLQRPHSLVPVIVGQPLRRGQRTAAPRPAAPPKRGRSSFPPRRRFLERPENSATPPAATRSPHRYAPPCAARTSKAFSVNTAPLAETVSLRAVPGRQPARPEAKLRRPFNARTETHVYATPWRSASRSTAIPPACPLAFVTRKTALRVEVAKRLHGPHRIAGYRAAGQASRAQQVEGPDGKPICRPIRNGSRFVASGCAGPHVTGLPERRRTASSSPAPSRQRAEAAQLVSPAENARRARVLHAPDAARGTPLPSAARSCGRSARRRRAAKAADRKV